MNPYISLSLSLILNLKLCSSIISTVINTPFISLYTHTHSLFSFSSLFVVLLHLLYLIAAAAATPVFVRRGNVNSQNSPVNVLTVQLRNDIFRFFFRTHGHETEASGSPGFAVGDQSRLVDVTKLSAQVLQV